jgi:hypothetical protein
MRNGSDLLTRSVISLVERRLWIAELLMSSDSVRSFNPNPSSSETRAVSPFRSKEKIGIGAEHESIFQMDTNFFPLKVII